MEEKELLHNIMLFRREENMKRPPILIVQLSVCLVFFIVALVACNPFPKKDTHPELPFLADLVKDTTKFIKVVSMEQVAEVTFLKDDRILLRPDNSHLPFKIIDINGTVIIEQLFDWKLPFYLDKQGNLYFNREKYDYPDYTKHDHFKTVVFKDSIDKKSTTLDSQFADSIKFKMLDAYEIELLAPYGLKPCEYQVVHRERCDVFEIRNNTLIVRQDDLRKNDFAKVPVAPEKFDEDVLIRWQNGRIAYPVYLAYYQVGKYKFKCEDMTLPTMIKLKGQNYLFSYDLGVFLVK
jgi:hypothetical protein